MMGSIHINPITLFKNQKLVIAFLDTTDVCRNRGKCIKMMKEILKIYTSWFKAIGGKVQEKKADTYY